MNRIVVALALVSLALPVVLAAVPAARAAGEPVNTMCPVMPDQPVDPRLTVEFEGKTIGFCCLSCVRDFRANPEAFLFRVPGFEDRAPPPAADETEPGASGEAAVVRPVETGPEGIDRAVRFAGRLHPALVHAPIALLVAAGIAALLGRLTRRPSFATSARFCLILGALGAVVAAAAGWAAAAQSRVLRFPGVEDTLELHRWTGTALAGVAVLAVALDLVRRGRSGKLAAACALALLACVALAGVAGWLGGVLVYGPDHYVW